MRKVLVSSPAQYGPQCLLFPPKARVLVTGGAGYLGSTLVRKLLADNHRVRVLDALLFGGESLGGTRHHPQFEFVKGDLRDFRTVESAVSGCDIVIHLAAVVGDRVCHQHFEMARDVNVAATGMLLHTCLRQGVSRFLFASTCSVYGASSEVVDESGGINPVSHYAETKVAAEQLVLNAATQHFHPTVLRLSTLFGLSPRPRFDLVVNLLVAQAACQGRIRILNGTQWRPFAHVADVAHAFQSCMRAETGVTSGQIFNVGDRRLNLQLHDLSRMIQRSMPSVEVVRADGYDQRSYRPSFQKIRNSIGFSCERGIQDGITEIQTAVRYGHLDFEQSRYSNELALAGRQDGATQFSAVSDLVHPAQPKHALKACQARGLR